LRSAARAQIIRRRSIEAIRQANRVVEDAQPIEAILGIVFPLFWSCAALAACVGAEEHLAVPKFLPRDSLLIPSGLRIFVLRLAAHDEHPTCSVFSFNGKICRMAEVPYIHFRPLLSANGPIRSTPPGMEC
jgi:hypothetical protein